MKNILLLLLFLNLSCNSLSSKVEKGTWCLDDGRVIDITNKVITFEKDKLDFLEYALSNDSIVSFRTENNSTWRGKLLYLSKDSIVYYDSLVNRNLIVTKCIQ